jgi:hypothetical protein
MKPAYHISLSAADKRLIADISAIQTQIEWLMRLTIQHLLKIKPATALKIMGSSSITTNAEIWIYAIRDIHQKDEVKTWAEYAFTQMKEMAKGRNDFLHTLYGFATNGAPQGDISFLYGHRIFKRHTKLPKRAVRVRTSVEVFLNDLKKVRDHAAYLSLVFAHIQSETSPHPDEHSPWLRRLGTQLPPQSQKIKPRKGKAPR